MTTPQTHPIFTQKYLSTPDPFSSHLTQLSYDPWQTVQTFAYNKPWTRSSFSPLLIVICLKKFCKLPRSISLSLSISFHSMLSAALVGRQLQCRSLSSSFRGRSCLRCPRDIVPSRHLLPTYLQSKSLNNRWHHREPYSPHHYFKCP